MVLASMVTSPVSCLSPQVSYGQRLSEVSTSISISSLTVYSWPMGKVEVLRPDTWVQVPSPLLVRVTW